MRVLYLTEEAITFSGTSVRGGAIHVRNVVTGLRERGHAVHLIDWNPDSEMSFQHSIEPRVRPLDGALRTYRQAVRIGRKIDAQIIISKTRKTYLPGYLAAQQLSIPHVVHVGSSLDPPTDGFVDRLDAASFSLRLQLSHDAYFVVCEAIATELRGRNVSGSIFDVRNAVDTDSFHPDVEVEVPDWIANPLAAHKHTLQLGYVGGLHDYKGVFDLAAALRRVTSDVHLIVAGDGPAREQLERVAGDKATVLGPVPYESMPAIYAGIDVLVLPSHTEGLPRVVLEAQATGTPVIATRVGGLPEIVNDGKTGLLVNAHDPADLAGAIDQLAGNPNIRTQVVKAGRRAVVKSYSWESMYDRYERFLNELTHATESDE